MDKVYEVTQLILLLLTIERHEHHDNCRHTKKAVQLAPLIVEVFGDEAELAVRIMARESSFRWKAVGPKGSVGYMGINPKGVATFICRKLRFKTKPRHHLQCARRIMTFYKSKCGDDPRQWLSMYKGWKRCGPSEYSKKVLSDKP